MGNINFAPSYQDYQAELKRLLDMNTLDTAEIANNIFRWTIEKAKFGNQVLKTEQIASVLEYHLDRDPTTYELAKYVRLAVYGDIDE